MNEYISDAQILIVDAHLANLHVLSEMLKEQGYKIHFLQQGSAVFSFVLHSPPVF